MENKIEKPSDLDPFKMNVESLEVSKMSKGYNWKIKIFSPENVELDRIELDKAWILRINNLEKEMRERFGDENEN